MCVQFCLANERKVVGVWARWTDRNICMAGCKRDCLVQVLLCHNMTGKGRRYCVRGVGKFFVFNLEVKRKL